MSLTGGKLNELNGKAGVSAPNKSVSIMKLIRRHKPKSNEELVALIRSHSEYDCECGIKSIGTIEDFGKNLFEAQKIYWDRVEFTLQECIQWEYHLFVTNSLRGNTIEAKTVDELSGQLPDYTVREADVYYDEEYRIDILVLKNNVEICGIQVKPESYDFMRKNVIHRNLSSNEKWGKPVYYLKYDGNDNLINLQEVVIQISKL